MAPTMNGQSTSLTSEADSAKPEEAKQQKQVPSEHCIPITLLSHSLGDIRHHQCNEDSRNNGPMMNQRQMATNKCRPDDLYSSSEYVLHSCTGGMSTANNHATNMAGMEPNYENVPSTFACCNRSLETLPLCSLSPPVCPHLASAATATYPHIRTSCPPVSPCASSIAQFHQHHRQLASIVDPLKPGRMQSEQRGNQQGQEFGGMRNRTKSLDNGLKLSLGGKHRNGRSIGERALVNSAMASACDFIVQGRDGGSAACVVAPSNSVPTGQQQSRLGQAKQFLRRFYAQSTFRLAKKKQKERSNGARQQPIGALMFSSAMAPFFEFRPPCAEELPFLPYNIHYAVDSSEYGQEESGDESEWAENKQEEEQGKRSMTATPTATTSCFTEPIVRRHAAPPSRPTAIGNSTGRNDGLAEGNGQSRVNITPTATRTAPIPPGTAFPNSSLPLPAPLAAAVHRNVTTGPTPTPSSSPLSFAVSSSFSSSSSSHSKSAHTSSSSSTTIMLPTGGGEEELVGLANSTLNHPLSTTNISPLTTVLDGNSAALAKSTKPGLLVFTAAEANSPDSAIGTDSSPSGSLGETGSQTMVPVSISVAFGAPFEGCNSTEEIVPQKTTPTEIGPRIQQILPTLHKTIGADRRYAQWNELVQHLRREISEMNMRDVQILHSLETIETELNGVRQLQQQQRAAEVLLGMGTAVGGQWSIFQQ